MRFEVRIGSVVLHGDSPPAGVGYVIKPDGVAGLFGGLDMRRDSTERPAAHGEFAAPGLLASRTVTLDGYVWGRSFDEAWGLAQVLNGLGAPGTELALTVEDTLGSRSAGAYLARTPETTPKRLAGHFTFTIHLWLPDPVFLGTLRETTSTGADASASHEGNFDAWPHFTVTGDMPDGYSLTSQGRAFEVPGPLPADQSDVVNFSTGVVKRNGNTVSGVIPRVWSVPGGHVIDWALVPDSGSGSAICQLADTYI